MTTSELVQLMRRYIHAAAEALRRADPDTCARFRQLARPIEAELSRRRYATVQP